MPRRKQPPTLRASSLRVVAKLVVDSCEKSDGKQQEEIRRYVQDIPKTLANEYVNKVLRLLRSTSQFDFTSALHPKCTVISTTGAGLFFRWPDRMLRFLHVMRDLIKIESEISPCPSSTGQRIDFQFPKMTSLSSIRVSLGSDSRHLLQVIENCPQLENLELSFDRYSDATMHATLLHLTKCKHLKRICVSQMMPEVAIHLLDNLPNLEILLVSDVLKLLPMCEGAYKLKDFLGKLDASKVASLKKVVTHFPHLQRLSVIMHDNVPINMISKLANLKSLELYNGNSSNLRFLSDECMLGLHELHLHDATGLDSLFRQNMNVSYQNLTSLAMWQCTGINVAGIMEVAPNLKSLDLMDGRYIALSLPCNMTHAGFQALEELDMSDVPVPHMMYLIPFCSKLKRLTVSSMYVKSCLYKLLRNANLKELCSLEVEDNRMKRNVIPIILDSCGEYLEWVILRSSKISLSPDEEREWSHQLQQYDMLFAVNSSAICEEEE